MSLNFCLMRSNVHEFADMLLLAEERGLVLNVCVVRSPVEHSLARLGPTELSAVGDALAERDAEMEAGLALNLGTWRSPGLDRLLRFAYASGVRYFDTAASYGSEPAIARWLQQMPRTRHGTDHRLAPANELAAKG